MKKANKKNLTKIICGYKLAFMRLTEAETNKTYRVVAIEGGCHAKDRLIKLGLLPGVEIQVKRKAPLRGPFMVTLNDSDIVIGRGIASKIEVRLVV